MSFFRTNAFVYLIIALALAGLWWTVWEIAA